ncbi:MAG TPA: lipid-A-disaccharide synthase [Pseudolabrys sp.]|nr:lipid-A-disaccharide synthase [Pseudolabrys sp.]
MNAATLHIFIAAGEESGDRLGAPLIAALKRATGGRVRFSGVGGSQMAAQGVPSLFPLGDLAIVGILAIAMSLPKILRRIAETADAVIAANPDVLVIIDSPEFTHRVARRVRARAPDIAIVDYVCPSVWAWRPWRARAMRAYVDRVLALLPFEPAAMQRLHGPPTDFVGHPLGECVDELRPNADEAVRRMSDPPLLLVLPGSRSSEIRRMAPVFGVALTQVAEKAGPIDVVVPAVPRLLGAVEAAVRSWPVSRKLTVRIVTDAGEKNAAFRRARAALTKSGTATLELALAGVPMVAAYKVPLPEELVARLLIRTPSFILANLALGENVVPEFLQHFCTPQALADALLPLLTDTPARRRQIEAFARLDRLMDIGGPPPSDRAAALVLQAIRPI